MTLTELRLPAVSPVPTLSLSVSAEGPATVVALAGEADVFTLADVVTTLAQAIADRDGPVVIDLARTDFIDSGTVRVFARARQFLADRDRQLTLRAPSRLGVKIMEFFGLTDLIAPAAGYPQDNARPVGAA